MFFFDVQVQILFTRNVNISQTWKQSLHEFFSVAQTSRRRLDRAGGHAIFIQKEYNEKK